MKRRLSRRVVIVVAVLLLGLWLLRPGAERLRGRVSNSIAQALGRNVEIGYVHLQFLPRPGFELENLVVYDDPRFGAEPLLRAPDVTAALRIRSLLRGRIEISNLSLTEASVNLTRDAQGKWNLEDLIDRTSHTSLAPTGAATREWSPIFPYIEAKRARVNFKIGAEKTHFAFTDAELALWQESKDTWGARLRARPIRTDANLTDTGEFDANALWRRSTSVRQTPVQISFEWTQAQLGQFSKLFYGTDKGWRGHVALSGTIFGTLDHLKLQADGSVDDFRQQDVIGGGDLRLTTHCAAEYDSAARALSNIACTSPSGDGFLEVKGGVRGIFSDGRMFSDSDLWLVANKISTGGILSFAQHANTSFPDDLTARGALNLDLQISRANKDQPVIYRADGSIEGLVISNGDTSEVALDTVPLSLDSAPELAGGEFFRKHQVHRRSPIHSGGANNWPGLEVGPVNLAVGKLGPLTAEATITRRGYEASVQGEAGLKRLLQVAKAFRMPSPTVAADGNASVKLKISGQWGSDQRPEVVGSAQLRSVKAQVRGLNSPIEITTANLAIMRDEVKVRDLSARAADAVWHGSMQIPRPCAKPSACQLQFKLHATELNAAGLNKLLNPAEHDGPWYSFLSLGGKRPAYLLQARASGKINVDKLDIGASSCSHFSSDLRVDHGEVSLSNFKGEFLDGTVGGDWKADFSVKPPRYSGTGVFEGVSLANVAKWMRNGWIDGDGSAKYEFKASGGNIPDLLASADISADFTLTDGNFPHVVLARRAGGLRADSFDGSLHLNDGVISFKKAKLTSGNEVYTVSGTASLNGALNLKALTENANGFSVTGTLLKTRIASIPATEAALKP